ncbi:MAG: 3-hydroxybutyrate dehydrogenase [Alphaproteobacteria bacterium]|nr:3-hydroxybutyrate dehydrogenase [Alphaproteobacteria bacterium]
MSLKGKTALVTGSTSGIGLAIARALAAEGADLILNGFGEPKNIEAIRQELENTGVGAFYSPADMAKPEEIRTMVENGIRDFGGIDILVNNAGIQHVAPVEDFPPEKWDAILAINLSSAFHTVRHALPAMKQKGWGRIINIASAHALVASPYKSAYVAAKHGLLGFTKSIALETAQNNITANTICPGYVFTPLVKNQIADTARARGITEEEVINDVMLKAQWTKKFVTVEQVAGIALFLCSETAENVTGSALSVDGGWTAA